MKRFTVVTAVFSVSILAVWAIFQLFAASSPETKSDNTPIKVQRCERRDDENHQSGGCLFP